MASARGMHRRAVSGEAVTTREKLLETITYSDARGFIADQFPIFADPQFIARFLARYELFKKVVDIPGIIIECGVGKGGGLFSWLQVNRLLDPHHTPRIIFGFDTFAGFPHVAEQDGKDNKAGDQNHDIPPGYLKAWASLQSKNWSISARDGNEIDPGNYRCPLEGSRIILIKGDFMATGKEAVEKLPHMVCALLYLDFDLYEPTKEAIRLFLPRMPKGSIIAFDELNHPQWPGETLAVLETIGLNRLRLKRFPFEPTISYAVLGD